jgi:cysteine dioxygenase
MGYHKVGNPDATLPAVTLHLYCPPFQKCKIWMDPKLQASKSSNACMCYYSEYGVRNNDVCDEMFEVVNI